MVPITARGMEVSVPAKSKRAVIFGAASFAEVVSYYLQCDSPYEVVGYTATRNQVNSDNFHNLPLVPFDEIEKKFDPASHEMFIAVGYAKLNQLRAQFAAEAKVKGYRLLSYVCSRATTWPDLQLGENCFVFEDNTIQPFVSIGDCTILWSGNHVGHHTSIGPNCFITSHVVISGHCRIGANCFIGVNATISENTEIGERNLIGPGTLIQKNTQPEDVFLAERTPKYPKKSATFFK